MYCDKHSYEHLYDLLSCCLYSLIPTTATWHRSQCCVFKDLSMCCTPFIWDFLQMLHNALAYRLFKVDRGINFDSKQEMCYNCENKSTFHLPVHVLPLLQLYLVSSDSFHIKGPALLFEPVQDHFLQPGEPVREIHWRLPAALQLLR